MRVMIIISPFFVDWDIKGLAERPVHHRVRLEGEELEEHLHRQKEKEAEEAKIKADQEKKEREELESSSESEEEEEDTTIRTRHDLMLVSESKQRAGFFKQAKKSYPMFPIREEKLKWDDYGEIIRPDDYIILEPVQQQEEKMFENSHVGSPVRVCVRWSWSGIGATEFIVENKAVNGMFRLLKKNNREPFMEYHGHADNEIIDVPTKCITTEEKVDILANVIFIDFEGRSDGESIRKILSQIRPRQLILVRGSKEASQSLADYCRTNRDLVQGKIHIPGQNELIDATTESHIYQVRLRDSVVSALKFYKAKEYDVAWIDATLDLSKAKTDTSAKLVDTTAKMDSKQDKSDQSDQDVVMEEVVDIIPTLIPCTGHVEGHKAVFINEPKLSDFKQILIKENIQAEFSGGVLICNNVVAVRRNEAGRLQLEGCLCEDYYKVRALLYDQFAVV
ncbi:hypothetical protein LSH36_1g04012 [Paralvinella palmiformis]|uniref:Cleavage and polyadenylation specificity factor subunit 2 n=1 Tax=Paralvinella palmiformis TaxID=53620 RepID=A0AAD9KG36_9ANNE|nr:hypothetical protein LSH36_1g04012 [Paralvinella palmiformis]